MIIHAISALISFACGVSADNHKDYPYEDNCRLTRYKRYERYKRQASS